MNNNVDNLIDNNSINYDDDNIINSDNICKYIFNKDTNEHILISKINKSIILTNTFKDLIFYAGKFLEKPILKFALEKNNTSFILFILKYIEDKDLNKLYDFKTPKHEITPNIFCDNSNIYNQKELLNNMSKITVNNKNDFFDVFNREHIFFRNSYYNNNKTIEYYIRPLNIICLNNNKIVLKHLIDKKINLNTEDMHEYTPLLFAILNNDLSLIKLLLDNNYDINYITVSGKNILLQLAFFFTKINKNTDFYLDINIIYFLIDNGVNYNLKDIILSTFLIYLCNINHTFITNLNDIIEELLSKYDFNINDSDIYDRTSLYYACKNNNKELIKTLLYYGATIDDEIISVSNEEINEILYNSPVKCNTKSALKCYK